jgi:Rrf2 family protein
MLALSKKTDYALLSLAFLAEQDNRVASAREIAAGFNLPIGVVQNILKSLQQSKILQSTRGVKGGYRIAGDLSRFSLYDLVSLVDRTTENCECAYDLEGDTIQQGPVEALHLRLVRFLQEVKLSDLVVPGRRIDVPLERVQRKVQTDKNRQQVLAYAD